MNPYDKQGITLSHPSSLRKSPADLLIGYHAIRIAENSISTIAALFFYITFTQFQILSANFLIKDFN